MRVLLVGDTHTSVSAVHAAFDVAVENKCDTIFQVGDFGFWPQEPLGNRFLEIVNSFVSKYGIALYFLAGNHEDWHDLDIVHALYRKDDDGFHLYSDIRIAPRANAWQWGGLTWANMSGAFSIDRKFRVEGHSWFPQEVPNYDDFDELKALLGERHIDIMLAHDAPVNLFSHQGMHQYVFNNAEAFHSQAVMATVVENLKPQLFVHGHWHMYYKYFFDQTFCVGLDQMTYPDTAVSMAVVDTDTKKLTAVHHQGPLELFELH